MIIENPTRDQIKNLRGIVYLITNVLNDKIYIGVSKRSFNQRYHAVNTWYRHVDNIPLKMAIKKYGWKNFKLFFVETEIKDEDLLFQLESYYAQLFNSYAPNGYNLRKCGGPHSSPSQDCINKRSKTYKFKLIDSGEIITIFNLQKFCKDNNIHIRSMRSLVAKDIRKHLNYTNIDQDLKNLEYLYRSSNVTCSLQYNNDTPIAVIHIKQFCDARGLSYECIRRMVSEKQSKSKNHRGWHLPYVN